MKHHWPARNLKEVVSFLSLQHPEGINLHAVSEKVGISVQALSAVMMKDDASLSWVERLAQSYGYSLHLEYVISEYKGIDSHISHSTHFSNAGNLNGLADFATTRNYSINGLANRLSINYRVIERALTTGNIKVSTMNYIVQELGISIKWTWVRVV